MAQTPNIYSTLPLGRTASVFDSVQGPGTVEKLFINEGETLLMSLEVYQVDVGATLQFEVFTHADDDSTPTSIIQFPALTAATGTILLRKAAISLSRILVRATVTGGNVAFKAWGRALSIGETTVKIQGASSLTVSRQLVTTTPVVLVGGSLEDRYSLCIKNTGTGLMYIAESLAKADPALGYPISVGESLAFDIQAGAQLYAVSISTSDVAIAEGSGA